MVVKAVAGAKIANAKIASLEAGLRVNTVLVIVEPVRQ